MTRNAASAGSRSTRARVPAAGIREVEDTEPGSRSSLPHLAVIGIVCLLLLGYTGATTREVPVDTRRSTAPLLVNREHPLDPAFAPTSLVDVEGVLLTPAAAADLTDLLAAARSAGVGMTAVSGYRPYDQQAGLVESYTQIYGAEEAGRISAPAGASEHQTGLAVDIGTPENACALQACFAGTPAGAWAAENVWRHGFIVRYPAGAEDLTGYTHEPWHLRWVGAEAAADMHRRGITVLEEYISTLDR